MSDPTKINPPLSMLDRVRAQSKRPICQIVIQWDPNTGALGFQSNGCNPVEEVGLYTWMINMRMAAFLNPEATKTVTIAPANAIPRTQ